MKSTDELSIIYQILKSISAQIWVKWILNRRDELRAGLCVLSVSDADAKQTEYDFWVNVWYNTRRNVRRKFRSQIE